MLEYDISQFVHWVGNIRAKINYVSAFCCCQYSQFLIPLYAASSLDSSIKFLLVHKNKKHSYISFCVFLLILLVYFLLNSTSVLI